VVPMAGGSLITKIAKAFKELVTLGWVEAKPVKFFGAQATGCSPISDGVKRNLVRFEPQKPNTIARSLAIGNPADGPFAIKLIRESGGWAEDISDPEIVEAIKLLAETEGIFTETAGGVTAGVAQKLIQQGRIGADETTVVCITGNGLKTTDAIAAEFPLSEAIAPRLDAFEAYLDSQFTAAATAAK
jgi:threonine synthase